MESSQVIAAEARRWTRGYKELQRFGIGGNLSELKPISRGVELTHDFGLEENDGGKVPGIIALQYAVPRRQNPGSSSMCSHR